MHPRNGFIVAVAATASLLLHAAVLSSFRSVRVGGGWGRGERFEEMAVVFVPPESDAPKKNKDAPEYEIGEAGAKGYASHKTPGDRSAVAREAPVDQAALSLDPVGTTLRPESPSPDAGDTANDVAAEAISLPAPPAAAQRQSLLADSVALLPQLPTASDPAAPPPPVVEPLPAVPVPPAPAPPVAASRGGGADPAPLSDSESDPFSVLGSARFVNGELRVRAGRKVRSRRPKIGIAGRFDAIYSRPEVTLRVATDKTGKVTAVEVVRSSGSNEIDQPCRVSMYDWWFEPKKDAAGNAVPDVFNFTIGFY